MKSSISSKNKKLGFTPTPKNFGVSLRSKRGFTLVELIVVMAIAAVMMTVLVINQSTWNDQLAVNTQAYELALMIRQAQIYSLGVRQDTTNPNAGADKFNIGYGVYFDSTNTRYIYFADRNKNERYDSNPNPLLDEKIETKTLTRGVIIKNVCGPSKCLSDSSIKEADIYFLRPDPKANANIFNNGNQKKDGPPITITLQSPGGKIFSVKVEANGQVSIQ